MDQQIYFKGLIEYLNWYLGIPKTSALDISSSVDLDNLETIWDVDLKYYLPEALIDKLKTQVGTLPLKPTTYLLGIGFSQKIAEQIIKYFGASDSLIKMIKNNPYDLLSVESVTFKKLDKIALEVLFIDEDSPHRQKAFIIYQLDSLCQKNGHVFIELEKFINSTFEVELDKKVVKQYLIELIKEQKIILHGKKLYPSLHYKAEQQSAEIIAKILFDKNHLSFFKEIDPEVFVSGYEDIQTTNIANGKWKSLAWNNDNFALSEKQKLAISKFIKEKLLIITGLPGTGKTTVLKALVDISKSRNLKISLMAPTGIAAKRLSLATGYEATTIHKKLGFDGVYWNKKENTCLTDDIIIIDEFSMVDQVLLYRLLLALPQKEFKLVLVGDAAQLPSVAPGNVLKELISSGRLHHVRLDKIFRQEDTSDIILNAHLINSGNHNLVSKRKDFVFMETKDDEKALDFIIKIIDKVKDKDFQVLSPTYKGILGVTNLNNVIQEVLNPRLDEVVFKTDSYRFQVDDQVMVLKNDYQNEVYNGEQGKVISIKPTKKLIQIYINGKTIEYSFKDAYSAITMAYSRTVHKCINVNTFIPTDKGILNFKEIMEAYNVKHPRGDFVNTDFKINVQGHSEVKQTSEIFRREKVSTIKIKTKLGYRIEATPEHPIQIVDDQSNIKWCLTGELAKGDRVLIKKDWDVITENNYPIPKFENTVRGRKLLIKNNYITSDIAWLMGLIVGNGHYNDKKDYSIQITVKSDQVTKEIQRIVLESFGISCKVYKRKTVNAVHITSKTLREIFFKMGFEYVTSHNKKIPISIRKSSLNIMASFLSGLFDSDGGVNVGVIHYTSVSFELASAVSNLLLALGIASSFKEIGNKAYRIYIQGEDSRLFMNKIGFRDQNRLAKWISLSHNIRSTVVVKSNKSTIPNGHILIKNLRDDLILNFSKGKTSRYLNNGEHSSAVVTLFSRIINAGYKLTTYHLPLIEKYIPDTSLVSWLEIIKFKNFLIDDISSLEDSECDVFDFNIPEGHDFVSNGFISHNCQGMECDYVIMPWVNDFSIQLQRNLLYTAITRAKKKVFIIGQQEALKAAIKNNNTSRRNSVFSSRILTQLEILGKE